MDPKKPETSSKDQGENPLAALFSKLLGFFGIGNDPDRLKTQMLKEIHRLLKRSGSKYIKVGRNSIEPALPKFFYEIYSLIGPAQSLLQNATSSGALKSIVVEGQMSEKQHQALGSLSEDSLKARAQQIPMKELSEEAKNALVDFLTGFDADATRRIDGLYNQVLAFLDFIQFNYYFLLRKFDSGLPERDFGYIPRFESISGEYIVEDLKDFVEVYRHIRPDMDWNPVLDVFKSYKNVEVVSRPGWKKLVNSLESMRRSSLLENMVMHLSENPYFKAVSAYPNERVVDSYVNKIKTQAEITLQKVAQERRQDKITKLVMAVFGTTGVSRLKNYTEKSNMAFQKKMLGGYIYVEALNYLKAFLLDVFKRDIREMANLLLVKGEWSTNTQSHPFSESFHMLMEYSDKITQFDEALAEDAERGSKFKVYLVRADKDANAMNSLKQALKETNTQALLMIKEAAGHLIVIGKHLKTALDDHAKPKHDVILNWKNLENSAPKSLGPWMGDVYKSIVQFIQLIQYYVKDGGQ